MTTSRQNWKSKVIVVATVIGAAVGFMTGYLLSRTAEESSGTPPRITTADAIKSAVGIIGVVRGIASLGNRD